MCSVEESDSVDRIPLKQCKSASHTCMKCSEAAVVLVRLNDPLCKLCFLTYFTHKFKAALGRSRLVRNDEKVLLAFSGGLSSSAMLHLVCEGYSDRVARKLRFQTGVVFIEESSVLDVNSKDKNITTDKIKEIVAERKFPLYLARLEDVFSLKDGRKEREMYTSAGVCDHNPELTKLKVLFESVSSLTAKEDLLKSLRCQVLLGIARREGYTKVMLGDCTTRLAVRMLSNVSQGRGGAVSYDTCFGDGRHGDVMFIRPMREYTAKEIGLYNFFQEIEVVRIPSLSTMAPSHASIDHLTEAFVCGLQARFPFTVSTIFRTGEKLLAQETVEDVSHCSLCGVPRKENEVHTQKKLPKVGLLSDSINNLTVEATDAKTPNGGCDNCEGDVSSRVLDNISWDSVKRTLCYGCLLTLKNANCSVKSLPVFVTDNVNRAENMKTQIKDFLL